MLHKYVFTIKPMEWMNVRVHEYMYKDWTREIRYEHRILLGKQIGRWWFGRL